MTVPDIRLAKNPDLRGSFAAIHRAARLARQIAIQTNTCLIVYQDGQIVRIPPEQLIAEAKLSEQEPDGTGE